MKSFAILIILFCNTLGLKAQSLKLEDLTKLVFTTFNKVENYLISHQFRFDKMDEWGYQTMAIYERATGDSLSFEKIQVIVNNEPTRHYDILYYTTLENGYNELNTQFDNIKKGVRKIDEIVNENKAQRVYCDGTYEYNFAILKDNKYTRTYTVWIRSNYACVL